MQQAVVRAKFCELIADQTGWMLERKSEAFLVGMFSLIDAMVGLHMGQILEQLPLADDVKGALLGEQNTFADVLALAKSYERAEWPEVSRISKKIKFPTSIIPQFYVQSVKWANCVGDE